MNVKPLKQYKQPSYPTKHEFNVFLAQPEGSSAAGIRQLLMSKIIGSGLIIELLFGHLAIQVKGDKQRIQVVENGDREQKQVTQKERTKSEKSIVVPIFDEALKYDGRGSVGCMAINPPTFMSESEAHEIICKEFKKAGIDLEPTTNKESRTDLDLKAKGKELYIEFISPSDYKIQNNDNFGTAYSYDLSSMAEKLTALLSKQTSKNKRIYGIFFDPLNGRDAGEYISPVGLKEQLEYRAINQLHNVRKNAKPIAALRLQEQVNFFLNYVKEHKLLDSL